MATKTILIETNAYALLAREKRDCTESFSLCCLIPSQSTHASRSIPAPPFQPASSTSMLSGTYIIHRCDFPWETVGSSKKTGHGQAGSSQRLRRLRRSTAIPVGTPLLSAPHDEDDQPNKRNYCYQLKPSAPISIMKSPRRHCNVRQESRDQKSPR